MRLAYLLTLRLLLLSPSLFAQAEEDSVATLAQLNRAYHLFLHQPDKAIQLSHQILDSAKALHNTYLIGKSTYVLTKAHWAKGNLRLSLDYGLECMNVFEKTPHPRELGYCLVALSRTFIDLQQFEQAHNYLVHAEHIAHQQQDEELQAEVYREFSMYFSALNQYDSALYFSDKGLAYFVAHHDTLNASILYGRKARVYFNEKDYSQSLTLSKHALVMDSTANNVRAHGLTLLLIAENLYHLKQKDEALRYLKKAVQRNSVIPNYKALVKVHELLSMIYKEKGNTNAAIDHLHLSSQYKDSVAASEREARLKESELLVSLNQKEKTINHLEQENASQGAEVKSQRIVMGLLMATVILFGALILVLIKLRDTQRRTNEELLSKNFAIEQQKEEITMQADSLQNLNQLKSKILSVISHDLRGPIATLHGLLDLLTTHKMPVDEFLSISKKVKGNIGITQRTLENLLNWSLSQMEGLKTNRKSVCIQELVEESCKFMDEMAERKNITLVRDMPKEYYVCADPDQVLLMLRNVIQNAIKFSKKNDTVILTSAIDQHYCTISIKDFGIGMTPQEVNKLIHTKDHFTKNGTQQEKGTGLGLLLCQEFIKQNEGTFSIRSKVNEGTEVLIALPLSKKSGS